MTARCREGVYCAICWGNPRSVPALVELRHERFICSECARLAVEHLVEHYGDVSPFLPRGQQPNGAA